MDESNEVEDIPLRTVFKPYNYFDDNDEDYEHHSKFVHCDWSKLTNNILFDLDVRRKVVGISDNPFRKWILWLQWNFFSLFLSLWMRMSVQFSIDAFLNRLMYLYDEWIDHSRNSNKISPYSFPYHSRSMQIVWLRKFSKIENNAGVKQSAANFGDFLLSAWWKNRQ